MLKTFLVSLLVTLFLVGCDCPCTSGMDNASFEKTKWSLTSFGKTRMAVPKKAYITFNEGKYSGYAGCNGMGGEYTVSGDTLSIKAGFSTMMACADMRLETKFRQEMEKVNTFSIKGDTLNLMHDDQSVLRFTAE
jgi:heat shock protein HslJ